MYLDADMLVFGDVAELASIPFDGAKVLCSYQRVLPELWKDKPGFEAGRNMAVMLLDCSRLDWDAAKIVAGLDEGRYTYEELVYELCIVGTTAWPTPSLPCGTTSSTTTRPPASSTTRWCAPSPGRWRRTPSATSGWRPSPRPWRRGPSIPTT